DPDHDDHRRARPRDGRPGAPSSLRAGATGVRRPRGRHELEPHRDRGGPVTAIATTAAPRIRRLDRFASVGSTNDGVRDWLAPGEPGLSGALPPERTGGRW